MFVFVLVCITLCPFWICDHPGGEGGAGCFAFVVFGVSCCCGCPVALPRGAMGEFAVCDCGIF